MRWLLGPLTSPALLGQGNTGADGQCHMLLPQDLQPGRRDEDISQIWGGRRGPQFCLCTPSCESWVGGSAWWAQRASLRGGRAARPVRASGRLPAGPCFFFPGGGSSGLPPHISHGRKRRDLGSGGDAWGDVQAARPWRGDRRTVTTDGCFGFLELSRTCLEADFVRACGSERSPWRPPAVAYRFKISSEIF